MTIEGSSGKELTWKDCHDMSEEIEQSNKQNKEIIDKYKITLNVYGFDTEQTFDVIKKLEIDIFQLQSSLKLSQELNASYEKLIKSQKEEIDELTECLQDANDMFLERRSD